MYINIHVFVVISTICFYILLINLISSRNQTRKPQKINIIYLLFIPTILYICYYFYNDNLSPNSHLLTHVSPNVSSNASSNASSNSHLLTHVSHNASSNLSHVSPDLLSNRSDILSQTFPSSSNSFINY